MSIKLDMVAGPLLIIGAVLGMGYIDKPTNYVPEKITIYNILSSAEIGDPPECMYLALTLLNEENVDVPYNNDELICATRVADEYSASTGE
jgi:hypothetical protein